MATRRWLQPVAIQPRPVPRARSRTHLGAPAAVSCGVRQQFWCLVLPAPCCLLWEPSSEGPAQCLVSAAGLALSVRPLWAPRSALMKAAGTEVGAYLQAP